ncbi:hypothetical protein EYF80_016942 [Liparis tanakae]|uniref:Uncharacterized protein n=1 Tax=Liparis tanakae TaxID=230148 RepID=A0A4Z2I4Y2_9TELE|nr:hypothetical protein EYF80_016942 [Liparis tanakae]
MANKATAEMSRPKQRGAVEANEMQTKDTKALECGRSVSEHVIELIEINIHDWAHGPGHLAARRVPTSVTVRAAPPPAARAVRRGVAGLARPSRVYSAGSRRGGASGTPTTLPRKGHPRHGIGVGGSAERGAVARKKNRTGFWSALASRQAA